MKAKRPMAGSVTVRLSAPLQRRLKSQAARQGKTPSELVRTLIERELEAPAGPSATLYERAAAILESLRGDSTLPSGAEAREKLERWAPDRRG